MKKGIVVFLFLLFVFSYSMTLDDMLKNVSNSPEIVYNKLLNLQIMDKGLSVSLSKKGTSVSAAVKYQLFDSFCLEGDILYKGSFSFGVGANLKIGENRFSTNRSVWYEEIKTKINIIDLYFDVFINPSNKDDDEDLLKYLCNIPLSKTIELQKPQFLLLKKDSATLFNQLYKSITFYPYKTSFGGYEVSFKVLFENPVNYSLSLNLPFGFNYDGLINDEYYKIISTKASILFRKTYRSYYKTLSQLLSEKEVLDKLNEDYLKLYNKNIKGEVPYSNIVAQKELIKKETDKIEYLSLVLTKYSYKILVLSGEK